MSGKKSDKVVAETKQMAEGEAINICMYVCGVWYVCSCLVLF